MRTHRGPTPLWYVVVSTLAILQDVVGAAVLFMLGRSGLAAVFVVFALIWVLPLAKGLRTPWEPMEQRG